VSKSFLFLFSHTRLRDCGEIELENEALALSVVIHGSTKMQ